MPIVSERGPEPPTTAVCSMEKRRFTIFAWAVLAYSLAVIVWGYFLRISESGDGCGTDWPLCDGAIVPASAQFPTWVEYTHRVSSGLALVLVLIMAFWATRFLRKGHAVRIAAIASLLFMLTESLFGALLVVFGWVAGDISLGRVMIRPFHVTNTFLLMAALGLTAWWASRDVRSIPELRQMGGRRLLPAAVALLVLAATGSWTGLAGTAFPAQSLGQGLSQYADPQHLLVYLRTVHPIAAVLTAALLARIAVGLLRGEAPRIERRLAAGILFLSGIQLVLGPLTILLLHPTGLRLIHLLLADLLWLTVIFLWTAAPDRPPSTLGQNYSPPRGSVQSQPGAAQL